MSIGLTPVVASSSSSKEKKSKKPVPDLSDDTPELPEERPKQRAAERERKAVDLKSIREQHERERSGKR